MHFIIQRDVILKPLQLICGVVERRQSLPILSHVLLKLDSNILSLTATDLEVEMIIRIPLESTESGEITLSARKFMDICRALPEGVDIHLTTEKDRAILRAGRSRFTLATLPTAEFPAVEAIQDAATFELPQNDIKQLIDNTHFSMAQQDVRYYLNGMLLELEQGRLRTVATDGHRLALCELPSKVNVSNQQQAIIPRKGVMELTRLLEDSDAKTSIQLGTNHIRIELPNTTFTSKLIDGRFPDYERVIPRGGNNIIVSNREALRHALQRAAILSNEKYRGVRLCLDGNLLRILANNPEQEEAEEELEVNYQGETLEIGFNVSYLLDAVSAVQGDDVRVTLIDPNSSCLIESTQDEHCHYVVMPMRL